MYININIYVYIIYEYIYIYDVLTLIFWNSMKIPLKKVSRVLNHQPSNWVHLGLEASWAGAIWYPGWTQATMFVVSSESLETAHSSAEKSSWWFNTQNQQVKTVNPPRLFMFHGVIYPRVI